MAIRLRNSFWCVLFFYCKIHNTDILDYNGSLEIVRDIGYDTIGYHEDAIKENVMAPKTMKTKIITKEIVVSLH